MVWWATQSERKDGRKEEAVQVLEQVLPPEESLLEQISALGINTKHS